MGRKRDGQGKKIDLGKEGSTVRLRAGAYRWSRKGFLCRIIDGSGTNLAHMGRHDRNQFCVGRAESNTGRQKKSQHNRVDYTGGETEEQLMRGMISGIEGPDQIGKSGYPRLLEPDGEFP